MANKAAVGAETIGEWSVIELVRFVQQLIREDDTIQLLQQGTDTFTVSRKLDIVDELVLENTQTTVGTAGAASAPPANPDLWAKVTGPDGVVRLVPLYKTT